MVYVVGVEWKFDCGSGGKMWLKILSFGNGKEWDRVLLKRPMNLLCDI